MFTTRHACKTSYRQWLLAGLILLCAARAGANDCLRMLPDDTTVDGPPEICQSDFNGFMHHYSCQDYRAGDTHYRVLYRGGVTPKAVLRFDADTPHHLLVSSPLFGDSKLSCPLKPPDGIPQHAAHRGLGVCHDADNRPVACSVYEHAAPRQTVAHRYMTFYTAEETNPITIETQIAGSNDNAMVAEIAYQLGMSLWETECCTEQAVAYLAYAYRLFPRAEVYRTAYHRSRALLARREQE